MVEQDDHLPVMAGPAVPAVADVTTVPPCRPDGRIAASLAVAATPGGSAAPSRSRERIIARRGHETVSLEEAPHIELSLIIPARNEEYRLRGCIETYWEAFETRYGAGFEIIIVTNGCTDNTVAIATEVARDRPNLRVHDVPQAAGKGAAVLEGFRQARGDYLLFADADASTSAASLLELAAALDRHNIAIGSRRLPGSLVLQPQSSLRRFCGTLFLVVVRLLFGLPYRDTQCGAKALRRGPALELAAHVRELRWAFDVDLLLTARALGLSIVEHPVTWANDGSSGLRIVPTALEVARSLRRIRLAHAGSGVLQGEYRSPSSAVHTTLLNDMEQR